MTGEDRTPRVVAERARRVDLLWGFLAVAFGLAFARAVAGDNPLVLELGAGALLAVSVGAWVWFRRHPARLEIAAEAIAFAHRGRAGAVTLRRTGALYVRTTHVGAKNRLHFLMVEGSDDAVPFQMFDRREVEEASRARGWRWVGD